MEKYDEKIWNRIEAPFGTAERSENAGYAQPYLLPSFCWPGAQSDSLQAKSNPSHNSPRNQAISHFTCKSLTMKYLRNISAESGESW
jgi:hypothetical protein